MRRSTTTSSGAWSPAMIRSWSASRGVVKHRQRPAVGQQRPVERSSLVRLVRDIGGDDAQPTGPDGTRADDASGPIVVVDNDGLLQ